MRYVDGNGGFMSNLMLLLVIAIVAAALLGGPAGRRLPRVAAKPLMTGNEIRFWRLLRPAAAPLHVAPQVAMGALLKVAGSSDRRDWRSARNRFDRKVVDFALIDDNGDVQLLVELDDRMHDQARDRQRDSMTAQAGYRTLRVQGVVARDATLLREAVDAALGRVTAWEPPTVDPARYRARRGQVSSQRGDAARPDTPV